MLEAITNNGLNLPREYPEEWVVDCRNVGKGNKALVYLSRYLYRGVINEKDILSCENGRVTFRYQNSKTKKYQTKTITAVHFLWLVFQHILPRGFRRARDYGFFHPNSKKLIKILQWVFRLNTQSRNYKNQTAKTDDLLLLRGIHEYYQNSNTQLPQGASIESIIGGIRDIYYVIAHSHIRKAEKKTACTALG